MPEKCKYAAIAYNGTLTFKPYYTLEEKKRIIDKFPEMVTEYLRHNESSEYYLEYTIEYHKVGNEDDFEAPHLHFILYANKYLPRYRFQALLSMLNEIGRSQLYLATNMKWEQYQEYIQKDSDRLLQMTGRYHHIIKRLELSKYDYDFVEEIL